MSRAPVFYDASGRRRRRFAFAVAAFVLLILFAVVALAISIGAVPRAALLPVEAEHAALTKLPPPHEPLLKRARHGLNGYARLLGAAPRGVGDDQPLAIAFHVPWDPSSTASLRRHIGELDWLVPGWVSVTGANHHITVFRDTAGREIINRASPRPLILPMIQNAIDGQWDAPGMEALLHDPALRKKFLDTLEPWLAANGAGGAFFDFEELSPRGQADYLTFLHETRARFAKHSWVIGIAVPVGVADEAGWNIASFAKTVDRVVLMAYDEHEAMGEAGPIASQSWFEQSVSRAVRGVPRGKIIVAIGNYGYNWHDGIADPLAIDEAWESARDSNAMPAFDRQSGNSGFAYEESGSRHVVWMLDAASAYNQMLWLQRVGLNGTGLWRLGSEDPGLWNIFGRTHRTLPPPATIETIPAGTDVDIDGSGEILKIAGVPVQGVRRTQLAKDGSIANVAFETLPSPYVVARTGYKPGLVALTFDDGPDPTWTPRILDILKEKKVPGTFFVIGENALTQRPLLNRMVAEGHEIGSHTYTHPNLAGASQAETTFQLNTTQRLFQAFTGHSLRLFRAPYFGDAEPSTADEIDPALMAQNRGYISVGLHVDPGDWKRPGVQQIIDATIAQVTDPNAKCDAINPDPQCSRNIVLLHDAGGDRSETVAALPTIIDQLRAKGYTFVPVSTLAGIPKDVAMPQLSASDQAAAATDLFIFGALGAIVIALGWLFFIAITVGIARAVILSALALFQARREALTVFPPIDPTRFVTVMIPAFNEELVIERAVRGVLASTEVRVEVIVIDDGSTDETSEVVASAFAQDPRVKLLTLQNGGKARALNHALALATGEIVIALDADTQFEPTTIARLARWFANPRIGAVAGNAKVGNRVNILTKFQAVEYITAQNLERRALARMNAMTVVPGAVGAWRLAAIQDVGGYPDDTLAEDQDLTIAIQRAGWAVTYDQYAVAWTESPETIKGLAKQRFRWAFGTLQCLWKHGRIIATGKPKGLGWIGLPQAILFQIIFAAISPIIDLALIVSFVMTWIAVEAHGWAQTQHDVEKMLLYWLVFTAIDLLAATVAFALERREQWRLLWLLIPQRIGYRQIMYYVVLKAIAQALRGPSVGWGKLVRTGRVQAR